MTAYSTQKIATALAEVAGKTIDRVFIAQEPHRFQLVIAFSDGSYYEFYGTGELSGARNIDRGDAADVRAILSRPSGEVVEIGRPAT